MKKLIIFLLIGTTFFAFGCKKIGKDSGKNILTVTIEPQKYFLEAIVGDRFHVECIVPSGGNPESADFTPTQMMNLDRSQAYFKIGYLGIENMLIDKVSNSNPDLKIINTSDGIELVGEAHVHCDDPTHDHGHRHHDHHHGHVGGDPHTWSSVQSAKIIAQNMYNAVIELDKENEKEYAANYNKLIAEFNQTDSIIKTYLEKAPSKSFIIYHPALSYFAEEYGLTQYSIEHEGKNPSPSQLKELIDQSNREGVKVVFIQQEFDTKNAETVSKAINGIAVTINLMSYNWSEQMIKIAKAMALENE